MSPTAPPSGKEAEERPNITAECAIEPHPNVPGCIRSLKSFGEMNQPHGLIKAPGRLKTLFGHVLDRLVLLGSPDE